MGGLRKDRAGVLCKDEGGEDTWNERERERGEENQSEEVAWFFYSSQ